MLEVVNEPGNPDSATQYIGVLTAFICWKNRLFFSPDFFTKVGRKRRKILKIKGCRVLTNKNFHRDRMLPDFLEFPSVKRRKVEADLGRCHHQQRRYPAAVAGRSADGADQAVAKVIGG